MTEISPNPMKAEAALAMVGLGDRLDHFPSQTSGGQQQRVAIARAMAKRPDLLLCDKPTGALDVSIGKIVLEVIDRVNRQLHTTTLVITHNASIAAMADRTLYLTVGQIGRQDEVLVGEGFAKAHNLHTGSTVSAVMPPIFLGE